MRKLLLSFVAAALAVPAFAASGASSTPGQPEQAQAPKKEKKICKSMHTSDSRIATSECKTAEEWARDPNIKGARSTLSAGPTGTDH